MNQRRPVKEVSLATGKLFAAVTDILRLGIQRWISYSATSGARSEHTTTGSPQPTSDSSSSGQGTQINGVMIGDRSTVMGSLDEFGSFWQLGRPPGRSEPYVEEGQ